MIHFDINMDDLTEIERALGMAKDKSKMVLRTAINNTAKELYVKVPNEAKKKYKYLSGTVSDMREANEPLQKATVRKLYVVFRAKGTVNELLDFTVKPRNYYPGSVGAPKWVKSKVLRSGRLQGVALRPEAAGDKYKTFVVKYESGHLAVAQRVPGSHMKGNPAKEAIKSLTSPSVPKMEEIVYNDELADKMFDLLQRNIQTQIERYLG